MANSQTPPTREGALYTWALNLYTKTTTDPTRYDITAEQVVPYATAFELFQTQYLKSIDPQQRTTPIVRLKNDLKKEMIKKARLLVGTLQNANGMTNEKREELEIPIRDQPTPVPAPTEMPVLTIKSVQGNLIELQLLDQDENKARPAGATMANIYSFVGEVAATDLKAWSFEGATTRLDPQFEVGSTVPLGSRVWVTAQWVNAKGQTGPACAPVGTWTNRSGLQQAA